MTNREFSKDKEFIKCCEIAKVIPTKRQASKFRRKMGLAYKIGRAKNGQQGIYPQEWEFKG